MIRRRHLHRGHWNHLLSKLAEQHGDAAQYASNGFAVVEPEGRRVCMVATFDDGGFGGDIAVNVAGSGAAARARELVRYVESFLTADPPNTSAEEPFMRDKVFVSYSHADKDWLTPLREQLRVLEKQELIEYFDDSRLKPGDIWEDRLHDEMSQARVAILLVSAPFLGSDFILGEEIPRLFEKHEQQGMAIYPLLVSDCAWIAVPWLKRIQMKTTGGKPLNKLTRAKRDTCLADVARDILKILSTPP